MVQIPMRTERALSQQTILSINQRRIRQPLSANTIATVLGGQSQSTGTATVSAASIPAQTIPPLLHPVQKGQRVPLSSTPVSKIKACLGWNVTNTACDVDVSAFLLDASGKVPGDSWFVFYGQEQSPDKSTGFSVSSGTDREIITVDFEKLQPDVAKIVFVLTINEALTNHLNFSMLKDAYVRILDAATDTELVSFKMDEYYSNVTSMMIGEIYRHNNAWKFNAIGNGVERDLAGLCEYYGVQVI